MDIKETKEALVAVEAQCDAVIVSCADGQLTLADLKNEVPVLAKARDAFQGASLITAELKDLDALEVAELCDIVVRVGGKMVEAFIAMTKVSIGLV